MKVKTSKYTFKAFALVLALVFTVLFIPVGELAAWARIAEEYTDYSYMTIGTEDEHVSTTVYTGATYTIANGYIGGDPNWRIGDTGLEGDTLGTVGDGDSRQTVRLVRSDITVTYGSSSGTSDMSPSTIAVDLNVGGEGGYGTFVASKQGTYTITYSYEYTIGDGDDAKTYYNYYDMTVTSSLSEVNIDLEENNAVGFFPSIIDLSQFDSAVFDNDGNVTSIGDVDFTLPLPTITDENGEEIEDFEVIIDSSAVRAPADENEETNQLLVTVVGGPGARSLNEDGYISMNEGKVMLDGAVFTAANYDSKYSDYTIRYSFYHNGQFVTSFEKESTTVYKSYYENYSQSNLEIATDSTLTTSAQPGVEQELPGVIVTTNSRVTPSASEVDVRYSVQVLYKTTAGGTYQPLDTELYNAEEEVVDTDGNLIDPTVFTPLEEGYYTFIYTAEDIYGNIVSTTAGQYEWRNIRDTQAPTAIVYDASVKGTDNEPTLEDASSKLKTHAYPNGVIIYAVGVEDNIATIDTAELRRVVYANSEELFTIEDYDAYNLIFNYRASNTEATDAYLNFINNNYLVRKDLIAKELYGTEGSDVVMSDQTLLDSYLKENNYLIVIDNGNASEIFRYFESVFTGIEGANITDGTTLTAWASEQTEETLAGLGFAYINTDRTFGASSNNGGFNYSSYEIRYWASDVANNSNYISRSMTLTTQTDSEAPTLSISTSFQDTYLPTTTVTFAKPTVSDNDDTSSRMIVKTLYRFLNGSTVVDVTNSDDEVISNVDLDEIFADLSAQSDNRDDTTGVLYTQLYRNYHFDDETGTISDGYVDLTDNDLSEYTIDLAKSNGATKVQIFAYAYDDAGNVGVIGREFNIAAAIDEELPTFKEADSVEIPEDIVYEQYADIELPTITIYDDLVTYMNYRVNISHIGTNGARTTISSPLNSSSNFSLSGYSYTVYGGTFTAPFAGDYSVATEIKDSANNTIVVFSHYTVDNRMIVQDPVVKSTLESQTVELDDNPVINIPTPTVDYSIDNSLDYESYSAHNYETEPDYVVLGVDADNNVTSEYYSVSNSLQNSYIPTSEDVGKVVDIYYNVTLRVYAPSEFTYNRGSYQEVITDSEFGSDYFTITDGDGTVKIKTVDENTFKIKNTTDNNVYIVEKDEENTISAYLSTDENKQDASGTVIDLLGFDDNSLSDLFTNLRAFNLTSDIYYITVQDTQGPVIRNYNYVNAISADQLSGEGYTLNIQGIEATDASGINLDRSSVSVTTTYKSEGQTHTSYDSLEGDELLNGKDKTITRNGTITISYIVYDNNGNSSTAEYVVSAGDVTDPRITVVNIDEEDYISDTYSLSDFRNDLFVVDLTKLSFSDDVTDGQDLTVSYSFSNDDTSDEDIEPEYETETEIAYEITETGTYTFTVTVTDNSGNYTTRDFTFTVTDDDVSDSNVYEIIGTVLIVISVLVLAGVIIYFVVSKVKLDKELKK